VAWIIRDVHRQPTNFFVGAALNLVPSDMATEFKNLTRKVRAGADYFLTQPIYRAEDGEGFLASMSYSTAR